MENEEPILTIDPEPREIDPEPPAKKSSCLRSCSLLFIVLAIILLLLGFWGSTCVGGYCDVASMVAIVFPTTGIAFILIGIVLHIISDRRNKKDRVS